MLDSNQIQLVVAINDNGQSIFKHEALAILMQVDGSYTDPVPVFPIQYRSLRNTDSRPSARPNLMEVWPNPTTSVSWLHYPREADGIGEVIILDANGRIIQSHLLKDHGLFEIESGNLPNGLYLIQLIVDGKLHETIKWTVAR